MQGVTLYGLVNNAGCGLAQDGDFNVDLMLNTNFLGPKRVSEAFLPLLDTSVGRIVNVSSGAASMWLRNQVSKKVEHFRSICVACFAPVVSS